MPPKLQDVPCHDAFQICQKRTLIMNSQLLALKEFPDVSTNIWFGISMKRLFEYQLQAAKKDNQKTYTPLKFQLNSSMFDIYVKFA